MKIVIIAESIDIGLKLLNTIIKRKPERAVSSYTYYLAELPNRDIVEIRLINTNLRGFRADVLYLPDTGISTDYFNAILSPMLEFSCYSNSLKYYGRV